MARGDVGRGDEGKADDHEGDLEDAVLRPIHLGRQDFQEGDVEESACGQCLDKGLGQRANLPAHQ